MGKKQEKLVVDKSVRQKALKRNEIWTNERVKNIAVTCIFYTQNTHILALLNIAPGSLMQNFKTQCQKLPMCKCWADRLYHG